MNHIIALAEIKGFKFDDLKVIVALALVFALISWALLLLENLVLAYVILMVLLGFFIAFTALSIRKFGSAMFFMAITSIFSIFTNTVGVGGWKKVIAFIIVGAVFELVFFLVKFSGFAVDVLLSPSISCAAMPVVIGIIISYDLMKSLIMNMLNLSLISLLSGFAGAVIALIVWENARNKKFFVKLRYAP